MGKSETENRNQSRSESLICITQYEKVVVEFLIWRETDKTHTQNERERERARDEVMHATFIMDPTRLSPTFHFPLS